METLTIGRLAERGGVNLETVRYYEREGLMLPPPPEIFRAPGLPAERGSTTSFHPAMSGVGFLAW